MTEVSDVFLNGEPCIDGSVQSCIQECTGACERVCPVEAITVGDDQVPQWVTYKPINREFIDGIGEPGASAKIGKIGNDPPFASPRSRPFTTTDIAKMMALDVTSVSQQVMTTASTRTGRQQQRTTGSACATPDSDTRRHGGVGSVDAVVESWCEITRTLTEASDRPPESLA